MLQAESNKQHEMGKNHMSIMVLRIQRKFRWMILMGVKKNTQNVSKKLKSGGCEQPLQVADVGFKISQKWPEHSLFWLVWLSRMSIEGIICIGTNLNDKEASLITV